MAAEICEVVVQSHINIYIDNPTLETLLPCQSNYFYFSGAW